MQGLRQMAHFPCQALLRSFNIARGLCPASFGGLLGRSRRLRGRGRHRGWSSGWQGGRIRSRRSWSRFGNRRLGWEGNIARHRCGRHLYQPEAVEGLVVTDTHRDQIAGFDLGDPLVVTWLGRPPVVRTSVHALHDKHHCADQTFRLRRPALAVGSGGDDLHVERRLFSPDRLHTAFDGSLKTCRRRRHSTIKHAGRLHRRAGGSFGWRIASFWRSRHRCRRNCVNRQGGDRCRCGWRRCRRHGSWHRRSGGRSLRGFRFRGSRNFGVGIRSRSRPRNPLHPLGCVTGWRFRFRFELSGNGRRSAAGRQGTGFSQEAIRNGGRTFLHARDLNTAWFPPMALILCETRRPGT